MARPLKVYHWQSFRREASSARNYNSNQTDEVMAAHSMAEVARAMGVNRPAQLFNLGETWNKLDIETVMAEPGVVFWRPMSPYGSPTAARSNPRSVAAGSLITGIASVAGSARNQDPGRSKMDNKTYMAWFQLFSALVAHKSEEGDQLDVRFDVKCTDNGRSCRIRVSSRGNMSMHQIVDASRIADRLTQDGPLSDVVGVIVNGGVEFQHCS